MQELLWLNNREDVEINRDWSAPRVDIQQAEESYQVCCTGTLYFYGTLTIYINYIQLIDAGQLLFKIYILT